jgi:hypothetical protein
VDPVDPELEVDAYQEWLAAALTRAHEQLSYVHAHTNDTWVDNQRRLAQLEDKEE